MSERRVIGPYTAYTIAVAHGYTGTEAEWVAEQEKLRNEAAASATAAAASAAEAEATKNTAVTQINAAGTAQISAVNTAGSTQVINVNNAGATQVTAIENKGAETLESIPDDYTTLGNTVSQLSGEIVEKITLNGEYVDCDIEAEDGIINTSGTVSASGHHLIVTVSEGQKYKIGGWSYNSSFRGAWFVTTSGSVVAITDTSLTGSFDLEITVPSGVTAMKINGRSNKTAYVQLYTLNSSDDFWTAWENMTMSVKPNDTADGYIVSLPLCDVQLKKKSGNSLMDFYSWSDSDGIIMGGKTDWVSPHIVFAVNDIDGDLPDSALFTGGWHMYNNNTDGDYTPTARTVSVRVLGDGVDITEAGGTCKNCRIEWVNRLQASNTEKEDGTGREVVEEHITADFDGTGRIIVSGEITALEAVQYSRLYGLSMFYSGKMRTEGSSVYYIGSRNNRGDNSATITTSKRTTSGDNYGNAVRYVGDTYTFEMGLDPTVDIGSFYANGGTNYSALSISGKSYMCPIFCASGDYLSLAEGDKIYWRGYYDIEKAMA